MITAFFTGVVVAIPTSLIAMKLLNSSLFISNSDLLDINQKISVLIHHMDDYNFNIPLFWINGYFVPKYLWSNYCTSSGNINVDVCC